MNKLKTIIFTVILIALFCGTSIAQTANTKRVDLSIGYYPNPAKSRALGLGKIYVGNVDTDPTIVGNQKTVSALQENGTLVAITQPVSLSAGGVPTYNGSSVSLYVEGDYALAVHDSGDNQIYYIPDSDASLARYSPTYVTSDCGATCDGTADDTTTIQACVDALPLVATSPTTYRKGAIIFPSDTTCRLTDTITVPSGVSLIGERAVSPYNDTLSDYFGSTILIDKTTSGPAIKVEGSQLKGTNGSIENLIFVQPDTVFNAGPYSGLGAILLEDTFMFQIRNCVFSRIGGDFAIRDGGHGTQITDSIFTKIGDASPGAFDWAANPSERANYFTAGICIDQVVDPGFDGQYANNFIEKCGLYGVRAQNNTKLTGNFIDLNKIGVWVKGERVMLTGNSIKWNMLHGVFVEDGDDLLITGGQITGNNYYSYDNTTAAGYGLRIADGGALVEVTNVSFVDDYENNTSHNPFKSKRQIDMHAGPAGATGLINNCYFSDPDNMSTVYSAIFDPNDNLDNRLVRLNKCYFGDGAITAANENTSVGDYEGVSSGTWTATISTDSGTVTLDSDNDTMSWSRDELLVHFRGRIQVASVSTPSGGLRVAGLPFTPASSAEGSDVSAVSLFVGGLNGTANVLQARIIPGFTSIAITEFDGTDSVDNASIYMQSGTALTFSGHYKTTD